jgi:hypothetical protein
MYKQEQSRPKISASVCPNIFSAPRFQPTIRRALSIRVQGIILHPVDQQPVAQINCGEVFLEEVLVPLTEMRVTQ